MRAIVKAGLLVFLFTLPAAAQYRDRSYRDQDRYSAYRAGYDEGYRDGLREGNRDFRTGRRYDARNRNSDRGGRVYDYRYGRAGDYRKGYRDGYREGYNAGYRGGNRGRNRGRWF